MWPDSTLAQAGLAGAAGSGAGLLAGWPGGCLACWRAGRLPVGWLAWLAVWLAGPMCPLGSKSALTLRVLTCTCRILSPSPSMCNMWYMPMDNTSGSANLAKVQKKYEKSCKKVHLLREHALVWHHLARFHVGSGRAGWSSWFRGWPAGWLAGWLPGWQVGWPVGRKCVNPYYIWLLLNGLAARAPWAYWAPSLDWHSEYWLAHVIYLSPIYIYFTINLSIYM